MDLKGFPHLEGRIDELVQAGQLDPAVVKQRKILPRAKPTGPAPLIAGTQAATESWLVQYHRDGAGRPSPGVSCYVVRNLKINGIGYAHIQDKLIVTPEVIPGYWLRKLHEDWATEPARLAALPVRRIAGQTLAFTGWGTDTYGHFLVEMLPRLLVARRCLGEAFAETKLLLPTTAPPWFETMVTTALGIAPVFERFDPHREQVVLSRGILPALAFQDDGFNPALNPLIDAMRDAITGGPQPSLAPRLFITRALFFNPATAKRRCQNELALAEIAAREYAFAVVAPETFPWETQVRLMAGASIIAGEFGSALHGAILAPPGTRVAVLGFTNLTQSMIAALRGQQIGYLPTDRPNSLGLYAVDEWAFRRFMDAVVR
jgi:O-antigen biosynthesis protein WbqL